MQLKNLRRQKLGGCVQRREGRGTGGEAGAAESVAAVAVVVVVFVVLVAAFYCGTC